MMENNHVIEYSLKLDSNPEFTSSVIVAYARAAYRMNQEGQKGCKTVFDVAPAYLSATKRGRIKKTFVIIYNRHITKDKKEDSFCNFRESCSFFVCGKKM